MIEKIKILLLYIFTDIGFIESQKGIITGIIDPFIIAIITLATAMISIVMSLPENRFIQILKSRGILDDLLEQIKNIIFVCLLGLALSILILNLSSIKILSNVLMIVLYGLFVFVCYKYFDVIGALVATAQDKTYH